MDKGEEGCPGPTRGDAVGQLTAALPCHNAYARLGSPSVSTRKSGIQEVVELTLFSPSVPGAALYINLPAGTRLGKKYDVADRGSAVAGRTLTTGCIRHHVERPTA